MGTVSSKACSNVRDALANKRVTEHEGLNIQYREGDGKRQRGGRAERKNKHLLRQCLT